MKKLIFTIGLVIFSLSSFSQSEKVYESVDKVPVFSKKGGNVQKFLTKNLQYPVDALAKEVEGKVLVSFVITSKGDLKNLKLEKGLSESTDKEALRVVRTMNKWKPAKKSGNAVATKMSIPVHFYLSETHRDIVQKLKPFYSNDKPPLFVLDNKKVLGLTTMEYYNVKSIRVVKGEKAISLYGDDAKNGVLVIETKRGTPRRYQMY